MQPLNFFACEDGHIESIVVGVSTVKLSYQIWDCRKLVLIYRGVQELHQKNAIGVDIGEYRITQRENHLTEYAFFDSWDNEKVLSILAEGAAEIYVVGKEADINAALYDVGFDYVGDQVL